MIGVSIVAMSVWLSASATTLVVAVDATATLEGIEMPSVSLPKLRLPRLPKRNGASEAVQHTQRRLKAMVADQEAWYAIHGSYGANASAVARRETRADSALGRVQVQILYAGKKGWTAMASHPDAPGKSCVIYVGSRNTLPMVPRTRADAVDASSEAQAACDR